MEIKALHIPAANMPGEETGTPSAIVFVQLSEKKPNTNLKEYCIKEKGFYHLKKFKVLVSFWYSPSLFGAAAGQDNSIDFSVFAAIAALSEHINCQDQCGAVRFLSGVSPAMPHLPCRARHCQCSPSAAHSSRGSPTEVLNQHGRWEVLSARRANTHPSSHRSSKERQARRFLVYVFCPRCLTNSSITLRYFTNLPSPSALCEFWLLRGGGGRLYF